MNQVTNEGTSALMAAVASGHHQVVLRLLAAGADVRHEERDGSTALIRASENGVADTVEALLAAGAEINHVGGGWTALTIAALMRDENAVRTLLHHGADVSPRQKDGLSAIEIAYVQDSEPVVQMLLSAGASPVPQGEVGELLRRRMQRNIGLVVNARGKMCLVHDTPFPSTPLWVGYHLDRRQLEIIFETDETYPIDWEATDEMDSHLQKISKILIIRMQDKKPVEGYDTSLLHLRNGKAIELE